MGENGGDARGTGELTRTASMGRWIAFPILILFAVLAIGWAPAHWTLLLWMPG